MKNIKRYILVATGLLFCLNTMAQNGLKRGTKAPLFTAADNSGKEVNLPVLLRSHKFVVLFFYRGQWCPYCNKQIRQMQDSLSLVAAQGAYVIAVTPETGKNIDKTIEKTHASFSIVQDNGYKIMKAYDVNYVVDDAMLVRMKNFGIDLEQNNGNADHVLPVPATYIINSAGNIIFVYFDKDYRKRVAVSTILKAISQ